MRDIAVAIAIGALSGSRSMLGPVVAARSPLPPLAGRALQLCLCGELIADKHPDIGSRIDPAPLIGRVVLGATAAAGLAADARSRWSMALSGAAGALGAALLLYHARRVLTPPSRAANVVAGVLEDAAALGSAAWLAARIEPARVAQG
jgi:uncharacterized membrane protein